jgi:AbrB family looped-hinge helix DNA binding protein
MSTGDESKTETTRITRKGQVTIPKEFREEFGLEPGDEVIWQSSEEGIVVRKANRSSARGMLVPDDTPPEKREEVAQELERRVEDHREDIEQNLLDEDGKS